MRLLKHWLAQRLDCLQIQSVHCDIKTMEEEKKHELQLRFTFEDKMDRELTSELKEGEEMAEKVHLYYFSLLLR